MSQITEQLVRDWCLEIAKRARKERAVYTRSAVGSEARAISFGTLLGYRTIITIIREDANALGVSLNRLGVEEALEELGEQ